MGAKILSSNDEDEIKLIANELNNLNKQRKDIENKALIEAKKQIKAKKIDKNPVIFASSSNWHPGIIGIVASRIKEEHEKPVAIISIKDGIGKASCRSINGVDFGSAIIKAKSQNIISEGGGHAMAAGFTVLEKNITKLNDFLNKELGEKILIAQKNNISYFSDILDINSANYKLAKEILRLEPFGAGNPKPKFLIKDLLIINSSAIGIDKNHVRCIFGAKNELGEFVSKKINAICFKAMENRIGPV